YSADQQCCDRDRPHPDGCLCGPPTVAELCRDGQWQQPEQTAGGCGHADEELVGVCGGCGVVLQRVETGEAQHHASREHQRDDPAEPAVVCLPHVEHQSRCHAEGDRVGQ